MKALKILALGRNQIKRIEKLDDLADSLEELWLSYNLIASLDGLSMLSKLQVLYMSNNSLKSFDELEKISGLSELRDVLFVGNPMYEGLSREEQRIEVLKKLPNVMKIDGDMVKPSEREEAAAGGD
jgi:dynein light chain 1